MEGALHPGIGNVNTSVQGANAVLSGLQGSHLNPPVGFAGCKKTA